jgi:hypothetical protein
MKKNILNLKQALKPGEILENICSIKKKHE